MSYDIWLEADLGGPEPIRVSPGWNYTSNCAPMWRDAGADLAEFDGKLALECLPILRAAIAELKANRQKYESMDPENGWGSYESLVPSLTRLAEQFECAPNATVMVLR